MKKLYFFIFIGFLLGSCEKVKFEGDDCNFRCYILSGHVYEAGSNQPIKDAEIVITAKKRKTTKHIVSAKTDDNGYWKVSFDADYIENLKEGYIEIDRKDYFNSVQRVYFNIDSVDVEQSYTSEMSKTAQVYYQLFIENQNIKRVESRFIFENQGYKALKYTNKEVPASLSFEQQLPANKDIYLSLWMSFEENDSKKDDWLKVIGMPSVINVEPYQTDTVIVNFH